MSIYLSTAYSNDHSGTIGNVTRHFKKFHLEYAILKGYTVDSRVPDPNTFAMMFSLTSQLAYHTVDNPWFIKLCQTSFTLLGRTQLVAKFLPDAVSKMNSKVSLF